MGLIATTAMLMMAVLAGTAPANATSKTNSINIPGGATLTANVWLETVSWNTCFDWTSSAIMNASPDSWIENTTTFTTIGFGSVNIGAVSIDGASSGGNTASWRNSNGATGSYLAGNACASIADIVVNGNTTATAFHYGNVRSVST